MKAHDATEIAYKRGYRHGVKDAAAKAVELILDNYKVSSVPYIDGEEPTVTCKLTNWDLNTIIKNIEGEQ